MIEREVYDVEPWAVRERGLDLDLLGQSESVFALANGHIGLRGNLDEGEPFALPGSYLNAFYEVRPLPYAETAYGLPDAGQTIVNVTNGKVLRLWARCVRVAGKAAAGGYAARVPREHLAWLERSGMQDTAR